MELPDWQAWMTAGVVVGIAVALLREIARPEVVFLGGLGLLLLAGVLSPTEAFAGFSNPAVLTIAALFVVAAGVQQTDALGFLDRILFARSARLSQALPRLMIPTALLSSFLNNTPIVAMLTPRVQAWAQRVGLPASKVLIPLSYAAIAGGMVTLIGTSTNIVVSGLLVDEGLPAMGLFDLTWVGLPAALVVVLFFALGAHRLLPDRGRAEPEFEDGLHECLFEVRVASEAPLVGQTVEEAGLRALGDAFLVHVRRDGRLVAVTPEEVLQGGDVLTFTGNPSMLEALLQRPGLERAVDAVTDDAVPTGPLYEAVVAESSSLVGHSLREAQFRERYGGVVLAIHRRNERLTGSLGRLRIAPGDLLLVEARNGFDRRWNARRSEFYLVAPRSRSARNGHDPRKARLALAILLGMVVCLATGWLPLVTAAFVAGLLMLLTGCVTGGQARRAIDVQVLVVLAAALGLGRAFEQTGLSGVLADGLVSVTGGLGVLATLGVLYVVTNVLTELITHKAAAILMLPVALAAARGLDVDPKGFALLIAVAAAASFMTPIGYQTNLMVMAAGGYRVRDYLRVGLPVSLLVMCVAVTSIYLVWIV